MIPAYRYRATVKRVTDADTIQVTMDLGLRTFRAEALRVRNLHSPELNTAEGKAARAFVVDLLPVGVPVVVETHQDRQTFNRYVADVWLADGRSLAETVIAAGHGTG